MNSTPLGYIIYCKNNGEWSFGSSYLSSLKSTQKAAEHRLKHGWCSDAIIIELCDNGYQNAYKKEEDEWISFMESGNNRLLVLSECASNYEED